MLRREFVSCFKIVHQILIQIRLKEYLSFVSLNKLNKLVSLVFKLVLSYCCQEWK